MQRVNQFNTWGVVASHLYCIFFSIFFVVSAPTAAEIYGTAVGRVMEQDHEKPMEGVVVSVYPPDKDPSVYYINRTDVSGYFEAKWIPPGAWNIHFFCPSVNDVGKYIFTRRITVVDSERIEVNIDVPKDYCYEPHYSDREVTLVGYLSFGFEISEFIPCDIESLDLSKNLPPSHRNRIWADTSRIRVREFNSDTNPIVLRGMLRGPGQYGHMDSFSYELTVMSIVNTVDINKKACETDVH